MPAITTISKKTDKSSTSQASQQMQKILKNDYLNFPDCGNLVGYQQFGDKWDFSHMTDYYYKFFNTYYYNNIHFSHLATAYTGFYDVMHPPLRKWEYRGGHFAYLAHFIAYTLFLNAVAEQKGFENIRSIPDDDIKEINDKFFEFDNGHFLFFDGRMLDLKGLSGIDGGLIDFIKKLIGAHSYDECRMPFLNIKKSSVKNLYDLIVEYTGDLNDPLKRKIRNFIKDVFGEHFIPETIDAIHSLNDLFEYQYERIERFIIAKGLIYQGLRNGKLELFERLENGGYQRLEKFSESALKQNHEFFDGEIDGKTIYISRDSAIKFVESKQGLTVEVANSQDIKDVAALVVDKEKKPKDNSKKARSSSAFTKMAMKIKNSHIDKERMWEYLYSMAEQENEDFKTKHSFVNFKIKDKKILWSTDNTKKNNDGETISKATFFKNYPKY